MDGQAHGFDTKDLGLCRISVDFLKNIYHAHDVSANLNEVFSFPAVTLMCLPRPQCFSSSNQVFWDDLTLPLKQKLNCKEGILYRRHMKNADNKV